MGKNRKGPALDGQALLMIMMLVLAPMDADGGGGMGSFVALLYLRGRVVLCFRNRCHMTGEWG